MSPDYIKDNKVSIKRLSSNTDYYNNVFKKTERLVSVTFYILSFVEKNEKTERTLTYVSDKAFAVHEVSLRALALYETELPDGLFPLQQALVGFSGALGIAHASRALTDELLHLITGELDVILRYLKNHYGSTTAGFPLEGGEVLASPRPVRGSGTLTARPATQRASTRVSIPKGDISSDAHFVYSQLTDRSARIKTVLEAKPEATIKDISEVITDVSEKTIQRELNSLIEKGQVIRQGERRWSKYSVAK